MSNYHRISQFKTFIASLKNAQSIKKLNDTLSRKIDAACNNSSKLDPNIKNIKEFNQLLTKGFKNAASKIGNDAPKGTCSISVDTLRNCQNRLQDSCKYLYSLPTSIDEKKELYQKKFLKNKHLRKLCAQLTKPPLFGKTVALSAVGLTLTEDKANAGVQAGITEAIPEPPAIPDPAAEALKNLNELGEPSFASLGLGGWSPVGMVQNCMEYVHVTLGVDWWIAIIIGTVIIRTCLFPLVILAQRNAAKMNNILPQMQLLQMKMSDARQTGDAIGAARYSQELMMFMKEKGVNPLKNMLVPLAQAPIFLSFFMGLREMANVPVESLRHGGLYWFTDLTVPDQFFILPIVTSLTLWLTVELGTDSARLSSQNANIMKYVLRAIPIVILPFTVNFPGAILCYWVSTNFISLIQVSFLRIPSVREYFKIEQLQKFNPEQLPMKPKGFTEGVKDTWTNLKITRELEERRKIDELNFMRAGKGPIQKTYKYDPTKQSSPSNQVPISAKKR